MDELLNMLSDFDTQTPKFDTHMPEHLRKMNEALMILTIHLYDTTIQSTSSTSEWVFDCHSSL